MSDASYRSRPPRGPILASRSTPRKPCSTFPIPTRHADARARGVGKVKRADASTKRDEEGGTTHPDEPAFNEPSCVSFRPCSQSIDRSRHTQQGEFHMRYQV